MQRRQAFLSRRVACVGLVAALALAAFANDSDPHADEALPIDVAAEETVTYSGVLSGTTSIAKTGAGTLILSNPANTFTGGITISGGIVKATAAGALGADANAISIAGSTSQANLLEFAAAGATFSNPITITSAGNSSKPTLRFSANTTVNGTITGTAAGCQYRIDEGVSVTFNGAVNCSGKDIISYTFGEAIHVGKVTCNRLNTAGSSPYPTTGSVKFATAGHSVSTLQISQLITVKGMVDKALPKDANVQHKVVSVNNPSLGVMDLGGHDQTVNRMSWSATYMTAANTGCLVRSPDGKASLTITGGDKTFVSLMDDIDLIIDSSSTQVFSNRLHGTRGDITVKKGAMKMEGTCAFQNVSNVVVSGGTLNNNSTTALSFASVTNLTISSGSFQISDETPNPLTDNVCVLTLGASGTIRVPSSMTLRVKDFIFDGTPMSKGSHTVATDAALDGHLAGGGEIYVVGSATATVDTWTGGGGANTALAAAANWAGNTEPDLETGLFSATFAAGGTSAAVSGPVVFNNLTLTSAVANADNAFSFTAADTPASIEVLSGLSIAEPVTQAAYSNSFAFAPPVTLASAETMTLSVPTNDTLSFAGGLTTVGALTLDGTGGTLRLGGESSVGGAFNVNAGTLELVGTLGPAGATLNIPMVDRPLAGLHMNGGRLLRDLTFSVLPARANTWFTFAPNTSNEFAGVLTSTKNSFNIPVGGSTLVFSGGINHQSGKLLIWGPGTVCVRGRPLTMKVTGDNYFATREHGTGFRAVWEVASNVVSDIRLDTDTSGGTFEYRVNDVFAGNPNAILNQFQGKGTHDFGSTTQRFAIVCGSGGRLTGAYPSALAITRGVNAANAATTNLNCAISGGLGIVMEGNLHYLINTPKASVTTCGDLAVEAGTLEIAERSGWLHGTNVFVNGGVLKINNAEAFDDSFAEIHFAGDGKIEVPSGVCQRFAAGWNDGSRMRAGVLYTAANLPTRVAGAGAIIIARSGTMIVFR